MNKVCGVIITYNFDDTFIKGFKSVYNQVDHIIIVDNNSKSRCIEKLNKISELEKVLVIYNDENLGIAKALNQAIEIAGLDNFKWFLTLDHDSILEEEAVNKMLGISKKIEPNKIGIICPNIYDLNLGEYMFDLNLEYTYVEKCIQSGAIFNSLMLKETGLFNEDLFIYYVDEDMCERARLKGYNIIRTNKIKILHKDGKLQKKKIFWKKFDFNERSEYATYYRARNCLFMSKNYSYKYLKDNIRDPIKIIMYDNNKKIKLKYFFKGIYDYFNNTYGMLDDKLKKKKGNI